MDELIREVRVVPGERSGPPAILAGMRSMPGCGSYVVAEDPSDRDAIWVTEVWSSADARAASRGLPEVRLAMAEGRPSSPRPSSVSWPRPSPTSASTYRPMDAIVERWTEPDSPDLGHLMRGAKREGHHFVVRTHVEWATGANRFDRPGEGFFLARVAGQIMGMCGLNLDPFVSDPSVGRLRHLYVAAPHRRRGIGRRLVEACLALAAERYDRVRLRTFDPDAARFYETLGFEPLLDPTATHVWVHQHRPCAAADHHVPRRPSGDAYSEHPTPGTAADLRNRAAASPGASCAPSPNASS